MTSDSDGATNWSLLAGPLIAVLFIGGTSGLALLDPGYSQMRQTISEIGSMDTPLRIPFAVLVVCIGVCELTFAWGLRIASADSRRSQAVCYLVAFSGLRSFGTAIFADPHPLHSLFGNLGLLSMLAPFVFAFTWRRELRAQGAVMLSVVLGIVIWIGIFCFTPLSPLPAEIRDQSGGVIQRVFLYSWMVWYGAVGVFLWKKIR
jgi:hypothetical membrane protein